MSATFHNGQKVHYLPQIGEPENGVVKSKHPTSQSVYFVVGDWANYENYTGAATQEADLLEGWV